MISRLKRTRKIAEESDSERTSGESTTAVKSGSVLRIKVAEPERGSSSFFKRLLDRISVVFRRRTRKRGWGRRRRATVSFEVETVPRRVTRIRWPAVERVLEYAPEEFPVGEERGVIQADSVSESGEGGGGRGGFGGGGDLGSPGVLPRRRRRWRRGGLGGDELAAARAATFTKRRREHDSEGQPPISCGPSATVPFYHLLLRTSLSFSQEEPGPREYDVVTQLNANWNEQNGGSDDPDDNDNNCLQLQSQPTITRIRPHSGLAIKCIYLVDPI
ncbi:hypothetical protein B0H11DRAFT_1935663 [Mycena galericulata]|nr:hypothetical protein B0H11DRAFT_1935663 [Mycena galericulata]